jgi:hypothetical protein
MKPWLILFGSFFLVSPVSLFGADARDHLSPHQRVILESKSPLPEEYRFGFDLPAGPEFTEAEKVAQRELGKGVMPRVMKAFESGAESVRIPPGDYRFAQERWQGAKVTFPLGFENMQRDAEHPFVMPRARRFGSTWMTSRCRRGIAAWVFATAATSCFAV